LLVCEGGKTEPAYFEALRDELRLSALVVEIVGRECDSAPISVVDTALDLRRTARRDGLPYDAIWCVFDLDQHESFTRAVDKARRAGLELAVSVPCFEYWLLLHFRFTTRPFGSCRAVIAGLNEELAACGGPTYSKAADLAELLEPRRAAANRHAERVAAARGRKVLGGRARSRGPRRARRKAIVGLDGGAAGRSSGAAGLRGGDHRGCGAARRSGRLPGACWAARAGRIGTSDAADRVTVADEGDDDHPAAAPAVVRPDLYLEVKRGRASPIDYTWFVRTFPRAGLRVVNREGFEAGPVRGLTPE